VSNGNGCTPLTPVTFRAMFPAFDPTIYPDATVQIWLDLGQNFVDCCLWGNLYQFGQGLWAAHELAKMQIAATAAAGGNPSGISGIMNSKSVGPVSVGYDTSIGTEPDAGQYNLTIYGRQYIHFARLMGIGPIQVGAASDPPPFSGPAWPGPPPWPGWFG
jgi:hypothetical protein